MKRNQIVKIIKRTLRIAILAYLGICALFYFAQERFIFFPTKLDPNHSFRFKSDFREKVVESSGLKIHSLIFKANNSKGLILYFHGNAGGMESWGYVAEEIALKTHWDVWMVDYPGYGKSSGSIKSQDQLIQMARDVYMAARSEYPDQKILVYGRSIGSGIALSLASENKVDGVILESPYTSLTEVAKDKFLFLPISVLKYPLPSREWIKLIKAPVLIIHGDQDVVIPFRFGKMLSEINSSEFVPISGGEHNNLDGFEEYWQALQVFLNAR